MDSTLVESVVGQLMSQLKNSRPVARANAVKTLASFGLCRKNIILSMLIPMADDDVSQILLQNLRIALHILLQIQLHVQKARYFMQYYKRYQHDQRRTTRPEIGE